MALFERDARKHKDSPVDARHEGSGAAGSSSDAEASAAHIAELVRRTTERQATPRPSPIPGPDRTDALLPAPAAVPSATQKPTPRHPAAAGPASRTPSMQTLVAGGAVAIVLIAGGTALSRSFGSDSGPASVSAARSAPAGYSVKVTDVITDCASHSRGRTKSVFQTQNCVKATRSLATGQVGGRQVLFVVSNIQMPSVEAAASIKQVLDSTGSGNLNDLLREGKTFTGAPDKMPSSGYASVQTGTVVQVAEAGFLGGGPSSNTIPALRAAAAQVAALTVAN
jgi:hypothetical protein